MADYSFIGTNSPTAVNTGVCTFSGTTISTTNVVAAAGDAVYFKISATVGAVGICQDNPRAFNVDINIYENIPASFTPSLAYQFDNVNDLLYDDLRSYQIENSLAISRFSENYRPYNTSIDYSLIVDSKRRLFNGEVKDLITTEWVVFKDSCDDHGYLVSSSGDTFLTLKNKFKSSLEFNIAKR
jgi:hypothetical protein